MLTRLLLAPLCWLVTAPAWAAFTVTFAENVSGTPWSGSASADVTISASSGDTVCVAFGVESSSKTLAATPVTDDAGSSYGAAAAYIVQNNYAAAPLYQQAYCAIAAGTVTVVHAAYTASFATNGYLVAWSIQGARATLGTPLASNTQQDSTGTTHTSNQVTITDATAMILGVGFGTGSEVYTNEAGWTQDANRVNLLVGHKSVSANETWDYTSATNATVGTMAWEIRPAATGSSVNFFPRRLQVNP